MTPGMKPYIVDGRTLRKLLRDSLILNALENAGVDNWTGYPYAFELIQKENANEECGDDISCILDSAVDQAINKYK